MDLLFIAYVALFLIGVWYAFRSGQLHERAKWENKTRKGSDY